LPEGGVTGVGIPLSELEHAIPISAASRMGSKTTHNVRRLCALWVAAFSGDDLKDSMNLPVTWKLLSRVEIDFIISSSKEAGERCIVFRASTSGYLYISMVSKKINMQYSKFSGQECLFIISPFLYILYYLLIPQLAATGGLSPPSIPNNQFRMTNSEK
jgi:hypothetical protein